MQKTFGVKQWKLNHTISRCILEKLVSITFLFSSAGKQLEQLTLETLKQQQDALHKLTSGVDELEKNYNNSLLSSITNIQIT